jgi:hypothetical protein
MEIIVKDISTIAVSEKSGLKLRHIIQNNLKDKDTLIVNFEGIEKFASMFFNISLGYLARKMGIDDFCKKITIRNITETGKIVLKTSIDNAVSDKKNVSLDETLRIVGD